MGTYRGFRILRVEDGMVISKRDKDSSFEGGFQCIVPVFSTQLIGLVGSLLNVAYTPNTVYLWDDHYSEMKAEMKFRSGVKNVLIRRDKIVIILENTVMLR